jgi:hypothetical protein
VQARVGWRVQLDIASAERTTRHAVSDGGGDSDAEAGQGRSGGVVVGMTLTMHA